MKLEWQEIVFGLLIFSILTFSIGFIRGLGQKLRNDSSNKEIMEKLETIESRLEGDNCFIYYGTEVGYVNLPCPDDLYGEHDRP